MIGQKALRTPDRSRESCWSTPRKTTNFFLCAFPQFLQASLYIEAAHFPNQIADASLLTERCAPKTQSYAHISQAWKNSSEATHHLQKTGWKALLRTAFWNHRIRRHVFFALSHSPPYHGEQDHWLKRCNPQNRRGQKPDVSQTHRL